MNRNVKSSSLLVVLLATAMNLTAQTNKATTLFKAPTVHTSQTGSTHARQVKIRLDGKQYEMKFTGQKMTELIVDGNRIAVANWKHYNALIERITKQIDTDFAQFKRDQTQFAEDNSKFEVDAKQSAIEQQLFVKAQAQFRTSSLHHAQDQALFNREQAKFKQDQADFIKNQQQFYKDSTQVKN
ncbi:MAG: hypothetical protein EOO43_03545 [Flavobacterium sp.]|nr:MAG: hypothetical protein EOO43_03545 [Flavobacterium sp.]